MKKLFKSFGLAVVVAVIALNALLVTGCPSPDESPKLDSGNKEGESSNPPNPTTPPITGGNYNSIKLTANRWENPGGHSGENWTSEDQIKLADFTGIKLKKGNTYSFILNGVSDKTLERVQIQLFSGNDWDWIGSSTTTMVNLGKDIKNVTIDVPIEGNIKAGATIYLQLNNIMWQKDGQGKDLFANPVTIPAEIKQGDVMATITNFSINLYDISFLEPPESLSTEERWWSYVHSSSTATLASQITNGIMTAVVGGKAMPDVQNNWNAWKTRVGYYYTAKENTAYSFKFEAWTASGTRELHLQYYEDNSKEIYLGDTVSITSKRTTYEVKSKILPTGGIELLRFHLADQLGTVYIKILEIKEYVFEGGKLTIANFSGSNIPINVFIDGYASVYDDTVTHLYFNNSSIENNTLTLYVWQREEDEHGEVISSYPFTGNITVPAGDLLLILSYDNGYDSYLSMVPVTFTGGNATITDFGTKMDYEGRYDFNTETFTAKYRITVTDVSSKIGYRADIIVFSDIDMNVVAENNWGEGDISGDSVTINLRKNYGAAYPFTGKGSYYLRINFFGNDNFGGEYVYTNGQTLTSLDITSYDDLNDKNKLPKCNISSMPYSIDFSKFTKVPEPHEWYDSSRITTITITNTGITDDYRGGSRFTLSGPNYKDSLNTKFSNDNITFYFLDVENGSYFLRFVLSEENNGEGNYLYTEGKTFTELGITYSYDNLYDNLPEYNISSGTTTINFNQFKILPSD